MQSATQKPAITVILYLLLLFCGVIWGMTFSFARIATSEDAHPLGLVFWQAFGSGLLLLIFCLVRKWKSRLEGNYANRPSWFHHTSIRHSCVIAVFAAIPSLLYYYAAQKLPVGVLSITLGSVPILTYALSCLLGIDQLGRWRVLGVLMGFVAIAVLFVPDASLKGVHWLILPLIASVCYTVENIYVDIRIPHHYDLTELLSVASLIAAVMVMPFIYYLDAFYAVRFPLDRIDFAILATILVTAMAYAIYLYLIKVAGAVFASMASYIITLSGVYWGILIFSEQHSLWVWASLALMLVGMFLVTPRWRK